MSVSPQLLLEAKLRLLQMHFESRVGHIGGNLSSIDLLMTLYHAVMAPEDRFVLSKGHAAGALYTVLWSLGRLSDADLRQFHGEATRLPGHPPVRGIPEIEFATGSLGHGLGLAAGLALAKRWKGEPGRVFCLTSDGEWNEGSSWEALIFIAQQRLANLVLLVDLNGMQGLGPTQEIANLGSLRAKFESFGIATQEVDGHNCAALASALAPGAPGPSAIVAKTHKGNGISFMQDRFEWHYLPLTEPLYRQAIGELRGICAKPSAAA
jgi:transketolase